MGISADGWFDWAIRDPGPPNRLVYGSGPSSMELMVSHSYEGLYYPDGYSPLRDPNRFPTAWCATNMLNGDFRQHYPVTAKLAHAGEYANVRGPGIEAEGWGSLHPRLNDAQVRNHLRVIADLREFTGKPFLRVPGSKVGLVEHREVMQTACPSGRYAPVWEVLEDEMATIEQLAFQVQRLEEIAFGSSKLAGDYHIWWAGDGGRLPENALDGRIKKLVAENFALREQLAERDGQVAAMADWIENVGGPALDTTPARHVHDDPADIPHGHTVSGAERFTT